MATAPPAPIPTLSPADLAAHAAASFVRRRILHRTPAGNPRGSRPAEVFAAARRAEGVPAETVYDYPSDDFLVVVRSAA
ncbi:hypothetical protein [Streptomyces sp. KN37]|uniref:hypothetical protein n=1 Tax=Streptomyces sp. KN37 TaxID=3090667 RepID=UPI002A760365|nr:hypothetical protein [Streptomyces sp. KN37]WPO76170.1 hypothetical protein R9806_26990 [Streptomyces sp. KN37]